MLLEYIGPQEKINILRRGGLLTFQAQEQYGGAKVLDVTDPETAQEFLQSRIGIPPQPQFVVFWSEPTRDPAFIRYLVRYPVTARKILDNLKDYPEDPEAILLEVQQATEARLRAWASELNLSAHSRVPAHDLGELIVSHYRGLWPKAEQVAPVSAPSALLRASPEPEKPEPTPRKKGGRPRKKADT